MSHAGLQVVIVGDSLTRTTRGQISGIIYVRVKGIPFPDPQWSDAVVVILLTWLRALAMFSSGAAETVRLPFMDGPFQIEVRRQDGETVLTGVDSRSPEQPGFNLTLDVDELIRSIGRAAEGVVSVCTARQWLSRDVEQLNAAAREVRSRRGGRPEY